MVNWDDIHHMSAQIIFTSEDNIVNCEKVARSGKEQTLCNGRQI